MSSEVDRAFLLGAVFGDGYFIDRGSSYRVSVTSGTDYPAWFNSIDGLFLTVFGREPFEYTKYERSDGYRFVEKYLSAELDELWELFGVVDKYLPGHRSRSKEPLMAVPPRWVDKSHVAQSAFVLGLVETDGSFLPRKDSSSKKLPDSERCCDFNFSQKDEGIALWVWRTLDRHGFEPTISWGDDSQTWHVDVSVQPNVARLGNWFPVSCAKWEALLARGCRPQPEKSRRPFPVSEPPPRFPAGVGRQVVEEWRALAAEGKSGTSIAKRYRTSPEKVRNAVRDVRWRLAMRRRQETREKADRIISERRAMAPPKPAPYVSPIRSYGSTYLQRDSAASSYTEARVRVDAMDPKPGNWREYLNGCRDHGLPTEPKSIWPQEWEANGGHAGYLGLDIVTDDLVSAEQARRYLSLGFKTWKKLVVGFEPQVTVRHKQYFEVAGLREHLLRTIEEVKLRADVQKRMRLVLAKPIGAGHD